MNNFDSDRASSVGTSEEGDKDKYVPSVAYPVRSESCVFMACNNHFNSEHLIMSTMTGGRIGKPIHNIQQNLYGLGSSALSVQLPFFGSLFPAINSMNKYIKYLRDTKRLTNHVNLDVNGYKTFSLEDDNPLYRLTFIAFNNGYYGFARFFNPFLAFKKGKNEMVLAKQSLLTWKDAKGLHKDLRKLFDATIYSFAKIKDYAAMTFFILGRVAAMKESDFQKLLKDNRVLENKLSSFFQEGLAYVTEKERVTLVSERVQYRQMVNMNEDVLSSVRDAYKCLQEDAQKNKINYYLGDCIQFEKDLPNTLQGKRASLKDMMQEVEAHEEDLNFRKNLEKDSDLPDIDQQSTGSDRAPPRKRAAKGVGKEVTPDRQSWQEEEDQHDEPDDSSSIGSDASGTWRSSGSTNSWDASDIATDESDDGDELDEEESDIFEDSTDCSDEESNDSEI